MCRGVVCIFLSLILQIESYKVTVTVKQGTLIGTTHATVFDKRHYYAFYGVPYARAPYRKLRFQDPKSPKKWKRPYDARTEYHGACAQAHIVHKHGIYGNEDCLNLNIYTPRLPKNEDEILKPVIVWIHGYAFTSCFSHIYGPDFLIDNDILFVSVTHRLGVFGFLKINETDNNANMGLKDIVMALKWIKINISKFGGDKNKVTVMGSDSGATFLSLILTTKFRKLFSKMILQSGGIFSPSMFQGDHITEGIRLMKELKKLGQKNIIKSPSKDIIEASSKIYNNKDMVNFQKAVVPFGPIIERESNTSLLVKMPKEISYRKDNANLNIPILIGFNSQESISEAIPFLHNPHYLNSLSTSFKFMVPFMDGCRYNYTSKTYKEISERIKHKYFKDGVSEKSIDNFLKYISDIRIFPIYKFIQTYLSMNENKMYVYKFNYVGKFNAVKATSVNGLKNIKVKGAASGDEICYILKCEPLWENYLAVNNNTKNRDRKFIKQIAEMWANFAKTGDPTPIANSYDIKWHPMTVKEDNVLHLGKDIKLISSRSERKMFSFWNEIYDNYYSYKHCNIINKHEEL